MTNKLKIKRQDLDGILLLNKPKGYSSNQVLQKIKRMYNANKAGHTGSLDPLATGMLPVCFGEATKFSHFLLDANKTYETTAKLGAATTTGDTEGEIIETKAIPDLTESVLKKTFEKFIGEIEQTPPMYSALKHEGQPLYKLARQGIEIERNVRSVTIFSIELLNFSKETFSITAQCSKGTYIRTLVEDIAKALNTLAHVQVLHRVHVEPFLQETMHSVSELEALENIETMEQLLLPIDTGLKRLPKLVLSADQIKTLQHGQVVKNIKYSSKQVCRLYSEHNQFLGVGEILVNQTLISKRLLKVSNGNLAKVQTKN